MYRPPLCWDMLGPHRFEMVYPTMPKEMQHKNPPEKLCRPLPPWWREKRPKTGFQKWGSKTGILFQGNYPKAPNSKIPNPRSTIQDRTSKIRNPRFKIKNPKPRIARSKVHHSICTTCILFGFLWFFRMMQWLVPPKWLTSIGFGKMISDALRFWQMMPLHNTVPEPRGVFNGGWKTT